jgi:DNA (cytosine-5)-methyltransferase 1
MAMNHWKLAVETHNTNFPNTDHDTCDISAADPRRYPSTDILITSPECTTHSPAGGNRRSTPQRDLFIPRGEDDPATQRSRATMRDVPRFAEYHKYRRIIVENVVEVTRWPLFHHWLKEMEILGYRWQLVSLNSMFCWPTPQSRDRLYITSGGRATARRTCDHAARALQSLREGRPWRADLEAGRSIGRSVASRSGSTARSTSTRARCRIEVVPFYYAALNAIDFSLGRGADRRSLRRPEAQGPRTLERIRYGLEKYGNRELIIRTNMTSGLETRVARSGRSALHADSVMAGWDVLAVPGERAALGRRATGAVDR